MLPVLDYRDGGVAVSLARSPPKEQETDITTTVRRVEWKWGEIYYVRERENKKKKFHENGAYEVVQFVHRCYRVDLGFSVGVSYTMAVSNQYNFISNLLLS